MKPLIPLLTYLTCFAYGLEPSPGCGQATEFPQPGDHQWINFIYEDKLLGPVERAFIIQIPFGYDDLKPLSMLFDVHWYGGSAGSHYDMSPFTQMGLDKNFITVLPNSMHDTASGSGSWNCSSTYGPLGPICDTNRDEWGYNECFDSCPLCDQRNSCDWTTCYDDIGFLEFVQELVLNQWCIDMDSMHWSGISNGGMLGWHVASSATKSMNFQTFHTVAASPNYGFGMPPMDSTPPSLSIIDMHGEQDTLIPVDENSSSGFSPTGDLMSRSGSYYFPKAKLMELWGQAMGCDETEHVYTTPYDGQNGLVCMERSCPGDNVLVRCQGDWGHEYPLPSKTNIAAEIAYEIMIRK